MLIYGDNYGTQAPRGTGRLPSIHPKLRSFRMAAVIADEEPKLTRRIYTGCPVLDQGMFPHCAEYSAVCWAASRPVMNSQVLTWKRGHMYRRAQHLDEWPGTDYDGTSVNGMCQVLVELGLIAPATNPADQVRHETGYAWAFSASTVRKWLLLERGPVMIGVPWWTGMYDADEQGFITPTGRWNREGHAVCVVGADDRYQAFRIQNSWGWDWGASTSGKKRGGGRAWLAYRDFDTLMDQFGEAATAAEQRLPKPVTAQLVDAD